MFTKSHSEDIKLLFTKIDNLERKIENLLRPAEEVILDDVDLREKLKSSKRTTADWRKERLITYSKIDGKIFYLLSDVLKMLKDHEIPSINSNLKIAL